MHFCLPKRQVCSWSQQVFFQGQKWSHSQPAQCSSKKKFKKLALLIRDK